MRERYAPPRAPTGEGEPATVLVHPGGAIVIASLLSPLGGGSLALRNARGLRAGMRAQWGIAGATVASELLYLFAVGAMERNGLALSLMVGALPGLASSAAILRLQRPLLRRHEAAGGDFRSRWIGVLAGVAGMLVLGVALAVIFLATLILSRAR